MKKTTYKQLREVLKISATTDLNLEDVLIVLKNQNKFDKKNVWRLQGTNRTGLLFKWELNKPLSDQSEKTQKFLLELIK